jgi:hypothetical protein
MPSLSKAQTNDSVMLLGLSTRSDEQEESVPTVVIFETADDLRHNGRILTMGAYSTRSTRSTGHRASSAGGDVVPKGGPLWSSNATKLRRNWPPSPI